MSRSNTHPPADEEANFNVDEKMDHPSHVEDHVDHKGEVTESDLTLAEQKKIMSVNGLSAI